MNKIGTHRFTACVAGTLLCSGFLLARDLQPSPLVLRKGDQVITIPIGDYLSAYDSAGALIAAGQFEGIDAGRMMFNGQQHQVVPARYVFQLRHGYPRLGHYFVKGLRHGLLAAGVWVAGGIVIGVATGMLDDEYYWFGVLFPPIFIGPTVATATLMWGAARQALSRRYTLGPDQWEFVLE